MSALETVLNVQRLAQDDTGKTDWFYAITKAYPTVGRGLSGYNKREMILLALLLNVEPPTRAVREDRHYHALIRQATRGQG